MLVRSRVAGISTIYRHFIETNVRNERFGTKVTRRKMNAFVTEGTPDARKNDDSMKYVSTVLSSLTGEGEFSRDRSRIFQS